MKDLKSLYLTAKTSGGQKDISAYTEAVNELLNSNPNDYILNLEYIISSDIGLQTLDTFIEKYGLSIACYDNVMECLEKCIEKCNDRNEDDSEYQKKKKKLKEFKENHQNCFTMYEYFSDDLPDNYLSTYYSFNQKGIQCRRLLKPMLDKFGEAAIPDLLITSESLDCAKPMIEFFIGRTILTPNENFNSPEFQQWMSECVDEVLPSGMINPHKDCSLESIVESMRSRNNSVYRESVITGKNDTYLEYSQEELQALQELISFKEYQVVSCENVDRAIAIQNEIYSLYEEFDGLIDEAGNFTTVTESEEFTELKSWVNTRNKKTGDIPDYIKRNHNVGYGEDEPSPTDNNDDVSLSDFERPSAKEADKTASVEPLDDEGEEPEVDQPADKSAVNNYYYYTYNNSLNKNSHSFNKDNSTHDNHSKHDNSVTNDSSVHNSTRRINDDHSTNKRINSHDYRSDDIYDEVEGESAKPWELNVFGNKQYAEAVGDADDMKPESDHPVKDILTDVDRKLVGQQQKAKKKLQDVQNAGRAFMKPINRSKAWISNILSSWKDNDETKVKEKMADPHARNNLFSAIAWSIKAGSFVKAGLLLNPVFLFLSITKGIGKNKRLQRIRNEMIGELRTELEIIDEKIKDADSKGDKKAKYQLMRLKNEINKKYIRVGGGKGWSKIL